MFEEALRAITSMADRAPPEFVGMALVLGVVGMSAVGLHWSSSQARSQALANETLRKELLALQQEMRRYAAQNKELKAQLLKHMGITEPSLLETLSDLPRGKR